MWGRALGLATDADGGAAAISKVWARLDDKHHLLSRGRHGRLSKIVSLREDGSGLAYTYPTGASRDERYLKLPFEYWTNPAGWYQSMSLPAKAMLLVALTLRPGFVLPAERAPAWYGISSDTADRGLRELDRAGLIVRRATVKKAPQAPAGVTQELHCTLQDPFARPRSAKVTPLRRVS